MNTQGTIDNVRNDYWTACSLIRKEFAYDDDYAFTEFDYQLAATLAVAIGNERRSKNVQAITQYV